MVLKSDLFRTSPRMQAAARNAPVLKAGERGVGPALLQSALIEVGFKMPLSTRKLGHPDGIFGDETTATVSAFQAKYPPLKQDGVAGDKTLHVLDGLLKVSPQPAPPKPAPKPPAPKPGPGPKPKPKPIPPPIEPKPSLARPPAHWKFKEGTADPPLTPDAGAGAWNSEPASIHNLAIAGSIKMPGSPFWGACFAAVGPNATRNLKHFFANNGANLTIPFEAMCRATPRARSVLLTELEDMANYIDQCPPGTWSLTSKAVRHDDDTYNYQSETRDWFFAIGGYGVWSKAQAIIGNDGSIDARIEVKFYDRYNWDGGKSVTLAGITITDAFMAEFHRQGMAREYNCYGAAARQLNWRRGAAPNFLAMG